MRRGIIAAVVAAALLTGAGATWWRQDARADEWRHGGDVVTGKAEIRAASPSAFPRTLAALGGPGDRRITRTPQAVVARVTWSGTPSTGGTYQFVLLDDRLSPARPLRAYGGWWRGGATGSGWDGRYEALAEHYPWLARTAPRRAAGGWTDTAEAVGVPAPETGGATVAFYLGKGEPATTRPERDLVLAMVFVDRDGEVRWAKQLPLRTT